MSENIEQKCLAKGLKLTDQRKVIVKVLSESKENRCGRQDHWASTFGGFNHLLFIGECCGLELAPVHVVGEGALPRTGMSDQNDDVLATYCRDALAVALGDTVGEDVDFLLLRYYHQWIRQFGFDKLPNDLSVFITSKWIQRCLEPKVTRYLKENGFELGQNWKQLYLIFLVRDLAAVFPQDLRSLGHVQPPPFRVQ